MYWVLHILGRDVRGLINSTCGQLCLPSTSIPFLKGGYVRLSPESSRVNILGTLEDAIIPHAFNSVFLLGNCITFRI